MVLVVSPTTQEEESEKAKGSEITCKQEWQSERNTGSFTKGKNIANKHTETTNYVRHKEAQ